jgi:hypothetical protein
MRRAGIEPASTPWQGSVPEGVRLRLPSTCRPTIRLPTRFWKEAGISQLRTYLFFLGFDLLEVGAPALRAEPCGRLHEYGLAYPTAFLALVFCHRNPLYFHSRLYTFYWLSAFHIQAHLLNQPGQGPPLKALAALGHLHELLDLLVIFQDFAHILLLGP